MDSSILTGIDFPIILGIVVSIFVMGITTVYDYYKGNKILDQQTSISNPLDSLGNSIDISNLKISNPFSGKGQKIREFINNIHLPEGKKSSGVAVETYPAEPDSDKPDIKAIFEKLKFKISSININLPKRNQEGDKIESDALKSSNNSEITEKEENISFNVDEIVENKKSDLDFDDDLINEMATSDDLYDQSGGNEPESDLSLNSDLSIDMDDFDFGFGETGIEQDNELDNEFNFDMPGDDPYADDTVQVVAVDDFSFDDDSDDFIESLKKDIVIEEKNKIDFMSEMEGVNLDIEEIKTELEGVLADLKKYSTF